MVNIPQGGMSLHTPGRGIAARPGGGSTPPVAARAGTAATTALTTADPTAPSDGTRQTPAQPTQEAARAGWSPARLLARLLRILTVPGTAGSAQASPGPRADFSPGQTPAGAAASAAQPSGTLMAALLRVLAGAPASPGPAQSNPAAAAGTPTGQSAATAQSPVPSPTPQEMVAPGTRVEPAALAAAVAQSPAAPPASPAAPGEHPAPRAELVPPGDGVRGRNNVDLPIVPAALVALALPALAAVLASIF